MTGRTDGLQRLAVLAAVCCGIVGCGGSSGKTSSNGDSASTASTAATEVDRACLKQAGFSDDRDAAYVALDGAKEVFADADAGMTIYSAKSPADARRIADSSQASEAHGAKGKLLFISTKADAAKVTRCL